MAKKPKDTGVFGKTYDYVATVAKTYKAWDKLGPNSPARTPESGQFWGAVLQNRKYDAQGKIVTGKPKPTTAKKMTVKPKKK
jgi:hypothetical protein